MDRSVWRNLPPEIIDHVLPLLPVKSLCRFKCISPSWNSLISSPHFAKTHLHITNNTPNKPQITLIISSSHITDNTPNKPLKNVLTSSSHALYSVDFAAENPTAEKLDVELPVGDSTNQVRGWGSCNGLVLVSDEGVPEDYDERMDHLVPDEGINDKLFLFNPFTAECKELPDSHVLDQCDIDDEGSDFIVNGVGYDSSTDDYKVVMLHSREEVDYNDVISNITSVAIYSLKTDTWRRIQDSRYVPVEHFPRVCFNERLHWLCRRTDDSKVVVAFDLWDEMFREVHLPASFDNYYGRWNHFRLVLRTCLCLFVLPYEGGEIDVWMMMKYGVRES